MSQPEVLHILCCSSVTAICGARASYPAALDIPHPQCPECASLDWAGVPCSLDCPFTTNTPAAMEDHR
jgi:hypothetical protein